VTKINHGRFALSVTTVQLFESMVESFSEVHSVFCFNGLARRKRSFDRLTSV
jgi:hypothetical protein